MTGVGQDDESNDLPIAATATPSSVIPLMSLRRLLVDLFTPSDLRQMASLNESETPRKATRQRLDEASIEELVEMAVAGRIPTVGRWRHHAA
jgi:hypothetical protein